VIWSLGRETYETRGLRSNELKALFLMMLGCLNEKERDTNESISGV
jgi:hypothetical protein